MDSIKREQLGGKERKALEHLLAFLVYTDGNAEALRERLSWIPNGWRDWRLMVSLARKMTGKLYETLTDRQYLQMKRLEEHGECVIRMKSAASGDDFDFVDMRAMKAVLAASIDGNCSLCVKNEAEIKGCKLRKNLYQIAPPLEISRYGCTYRDIVHDERWTGEFE